MQRNNYKSYRKFFYSFFNWGKQASLACFIAIGLTCWNQHVSAQNLLWDWAWVAGSNRVDQGHQVTTDKDGNVFVVGGFQETAHFGLNSTTVTVPGSATAFQGFLAKYSSTGVFQWVISIGGTGYDESYGVTTDNQGDVYVVGYHGDNADFDKDLSSAGRVAKYGGFLAKYSGNNGSFKWVVAISDATTNDVVTDNQGNVYITGRYYGGANFNPRGTTFNLPGANDYEDCFLAKYNSDGILLWANGIGGTLIQDGKRIAVDANNNIIVAGTNNGSIVFPSGSLASNNGTMDIFVAKYKNDGTFVWGRQYGGARNDDLTALSVDKDNSIALGGSFADSIHFNPGQSTGNIVAAFGSSVPFSGEFAGYLVVLDEDAKFKWGHSIGAANQYDRVGDVRFDEYNNLYVYGYFSGTITFGSDVLTSTKQALYLAKYSSTGADIWGKVVGTREGDIPAGMYVDDSKGIYITGNVGHLNNKLVSFSYGNDTAVHIGGPRNRNSTDFFVAKFYENCNVITDTAVVTCDSIRFNGKLYTASGNYNDTFALGGGCDSIVRLTLTVNQSTVNSLVTGVYCDSVSFNGVTYYQTGIYTQNYSNAAGCDSSITYDLEIGHTSPVTNLTEFGCGSFTYIDSVISQSGIYLFKYTNQSGCDSTVVLNLTVEPVPTATVTKDKNTLSSVPADSYQWIDCGANTLIPGATGQDFIAKEAGSYAVVIDIGGCTDTSDCVAVESVSSVSDQVYQRFATVDVYPNPAANQLNVQTNVLMKDAIIRVVNPLGQVLLQQTAMHGYRVRIDVSSLASGLYFVVLEEGSAVFRKSFVKQ